MRSLPILGAAIAALGLTGMPSPAVAGIGVLAVMPDAPMAASDGCEKCVMPAPLRDGETDLVVRTTLADGGYIAVWQSRTDSLVYGQNYSADGQPRSGVFRIDTHAEDEILPIIVTHRDGGFTAIWSRDGKQYERRFNSHGVPRGDEVQLK